MNWAIVAAVAAVAGAGAGWIPVMLARRQERDTLARVATIADQVPALVAEVRALSERLIRLETRLEERERLQEVYRHCDTNPRGVPTVGGGG